MTDLYVLQSALRENFRLRRFLPWAAAVAALFALALLWVRFAADYSPEQAYAQLSAAMNFRFLAIVAAVAAASVVSQEVEQKTIVYLLTRPIPRWKLLVYRALAAVAMVAAVAVVAALLMSAAVFGGGLLANPVMWRELPALLLGAAAYTTFFVFLTLLLNRAMIYCLLYAFGWEALIPNMPGDIFHFSIYSHMSALAGHPAPPEAQHGFAGALAGQAMGHAIPASTALPALIGVSAVALAAGCWWFTRFEYVAREDAE
jgi:ABC-2 type transport system permease protein